MPNSPLARLIKCAWRIYRNTPIKYWFSTMSELPYHIKTHPVSKRQNVSKLIKMWLMSICLPIFQITAISVHICIFFFLSLFCAAHDQYLWRHVIGQYEFSWFWFYQITWWIGCHLFDSSSSSNSITTRNRPSIILAFHMNYA